MIVRCGRFFGQPNAFACDAKCEKAWGNNSRPKVMLSDADEDDYAFLADPELGEAPADPGTYEGGHGKPQRPEDRLNKWCVRECERSIMVDEFEGTEELRDFSKRQQNIPEGVRLTRGLPPSGLA
jgi:hypothetical protein